MFSFEYTRMICHFFLKKETKKAEQRIKVKELFGHLSSLSPSLTLRDVDGVSQRTL